MAFYSDDLKSVIKSFDSDEAVGLSAAQVEAQRRIHGLNKLKEKKKKLLRRKDKK